MHSSSVKLQSMMINMMKNGIEWTEKRTAKLSQLVTAAHNGFTQLKKRKGKCTLGAVVSICISFMHDLAVYCLGLNEN